MILMHYICLRKKHALSFFCLLLIYALPVDKGLFKARANSNLTNWFSYFEQKLFTKLPNTVRFPFFVFVNLPIIISAFKTWKLVLKNLKIVYDYLETKICMLELSKTKLVYFQRKTSPRNITPQKEVPWKKLPNIYILLCFQLISFFYWSYPEPETCW